MSFKHVYVTTDSIYAEISQREIDGFIRNDSEFDFALCFACAEHVSFILAFLGNKSSILKEKAIF